MKTRFKFFCCLLFLFIFSTHINAQENNQPKDNQSNQEESKASADSKETASKETPDEQRKTAKKNADSKEATSSLSDDDSENTESSKNKKRVSINTSNVVRLQYGYPKWNTDSTRINSASVLLRDGASGRIVQISLQETEPDSSIFAGVYSISWAQIDDIKDEFYIPPQNLLRTKEGIKKLQKLIASKKLRRRPFILRREPDGFQVIELYDTRAQAKDALKLFKQEIELRKKQNVTLQQQQNNEGLEQKQVIDQAAIDAAEKAKELAKMAAAARAEAERIRLEQVERRKAIERLARQRAFDKAEREKRKRKAKNFADQALAAFKDGRFKEAVELFDKSLELDPENKSYMFQYGVSLYRTDQFNRSLVALGLVEDDSVNPAEKSFFEGLNYYRLQDNAKAITALDKTIKSGLQPLAPSAAFYKGIILIQKKEWDPATEAFQTVLNTSKDPKLDERAEKFIEQIIRARAYEAELARRWKYSGAVGFIYDSNITLSSDSSRDQGVASNIEGVRLLTQFGVQYRPIKDKKKEFATQLSLFNLYTVEPDFSSNQTLRDTDPTLVNLSLPYTLKSTLWEKGYKLTVAPAYETIYMSAEDSEYKEILGSPIIALNNTLVMSKDWFTSLNIKFRYDLSKLDSSTGDNDGDALKTKVTYNNIVVMNKEKGRILIPELSLTHNAATGKNLRYIRLDLAVTYLFKWKWETTFNSRASLYTLNYTENANNRGDLNYAITAGLNKKFGEHWNGGLNINYTINDSNIDDNTYNKMTILNSWSFNF